ncbi:ATP-NAD kinase family protein [Luteimonas sp. SJ-92]|uniref:ATP-NAD kinase family protein n=1 Tax=Luteimonas salinisoli TaxID=2752307 RepID=A0A853JHR3_9GAMM|nr:ATP-NAD kinase family protein [Luteimonas salinisoli]NZA27970.1 ATP-NAD kinase family protein [Luteimonas salinisoli]
MTAEVAEPSRTRVHGRTRPLLGFIVNPVAGMGGSVGLKGTDGDVIVHEAMRRGARPMAGERAARAVDRLTASLSQVDVVTVAGPMGEQVVRDAGIEPNVLESSHLGSSTSIDTRKAARAMADQGVDLILFAGGDGTARDILGASGHQVPMLGVPAGVKMHSAVFGTTPANAGHLAALFLVGSPRALLRDAEVMDLDEDAIRAGTVSAQLYGHARSPFERRLVQNAKAGSVPGENETLDAVARRMAEGMRDGRVYILGPGTTTRRLADALGIPSTLLGVDAVLDRQAVGLDLNEQALLRIIEGHEAEIIVSVLGGQGSLFGRGNQQISAEVIRKVGRDGIKVLSTVEKLINLPTRALQVDTGDAEIDAMLTGHIPVITGPNRTALVKVRA